MRRFGAVVSLVVGFLGGQSPAEARPLRIIHTNDLHSFMEEADAPGSGGYAAVKATIDRLKAEARDRGMDTLVLDAGDFSEGNEFFFADEGRTSWSIMDQMGYDAVAIGNHDFLVGLGQMDKILSSVKPTTPFLSANLTIDPQAKVPALRRHVKPYVELNRAGVKIAVLGLLTDELVYRWRLDKADLTPPDFEARSHVPALRNRNDFVIVLSHLGFNVDIGLARAVDGVDLIVGGHSHTTLETPFPAPNRLGGRVPIVQVGQHGRLVGDLVVDVEPGKPMKVLSYRLVPVFKDAGGDALIDRRVAQARVQLEDRYGKEWLYKVIGISEIPLEQPLLQSTNWGNYCADSFMNAAGADLALDVGEFYGNTRPAGFVTREDLISMYPRTFDTRKASGWNVWTIRAPGWLIRYVLETAANSSLHLNTAGVTFERTKDPKTGKVGLRKIRIKGRKLRALREYTLAVTEGIGRGALELSTVLALFFQPRDTGIPVWASIENHIRSQGGRIRAPASMPTAISSNAEAASLLQ